MSASRTPRLHDSPTILLATMFSARRSGDRCLERLSLRRLRALGIHIQFADADRPRRKVVTHVH